MELIGTLIGTLIGLLIIAGVLAIPLIALLLIAAGIKMWIEVAEETKLEEERQRIAQEHWESMNIAEKSGSVVLVVTAGTASIVGTIVFGATVLAVGAIALPFMLAHSFGSYLLGSEN